MRLCLRSLSGDEWQGGALYVRNLASAIASLPPDQRADVELTIELRKPTTETLARFRETADEVFTPSRFAAALRGWAKGRRVELPTRLTNPRGFDFIYPELAGPGVRYAWAGWIPDFQYLHLPELFPPAELARRRANSDAVARLAPSVVLSSEVAHRDFADAYPEQAHKAVVLHFASTMAPDVYRADPAATAARYGLSERFFLISNQLWAHKNHMLAAEALARLGPDGPTIVCTGGTYEPRDPDLLDRLRARLDELGIPDRFVILGLIPRLDQLQLMRRCVAVIQPSRFEGWSTVIEDAKALGRPVLASDIAVHLEQSPPDASYFSPDDPDALAALMAEHASRTPGPDHEAEERALTATAARVQAYGARFLEMARGLARAG